MKSINAIWVVILIGLTLSGCGGGGGSTPAVTPIPDVPVELPVPADPPADPVIDEGTIIWTAPDVGDNLEAVPAVDDNNNVYVAGGDSMESYDSDGNLRWKTTPVANAVLGESSSPALSADNLIVYLAADAGVFAFDAANGDLLWQKLVPADFPQIFATVPTVSSDGNRLYVGAGDNLHPSDNFYSIDTSNGDIVWTYTLELDPLQFEDNSFIEGFLGGAIIHPNGSIIIASQHGYLISLTDNGNSYTENWVFSVGAEMRQPPSVDGEGYILQASNLSRIEKIDPTTGLSVGGNWPVSLDTGEIFTSVAINADNTLYTNTESGHLYSISADGLIQWSLLLQSWSSDPVIRNDGNILLVANNSDSGLKGHVMCIEDQGTAAAILWSTPIIPKTDTNETNVNIAPNGTIYVTGGEEGILYALQGNGQGLSASAHWPKAMHNIQNNGN
ncbi:MAG: PQQ-binding-like beta-propeller repeat protein [Algicola sp.]|nr:PQQ-binding-like beta-propeller repeat protein [Algicola sp.]